MYTGSLVNSHNIIVTLDGHKEHMEEEEKPRNAFLIENYSRNSLRISTSPLNEK